MSKAKAIGIRALALCAALAIALLVLEGAVRLRQWKKYGAASPTILELVEDPSSGLMIPTPGMKRAGIAINRMGFRSPEIDDPKPPGTFRIAYLGGSATYCAEVSAQEITWPHIVTEQVRERYPDRLVDYVNAGVPGYSTTQSIKNLESRIAALDPDIIVIYHGTNDLSADTRQMAESLGIWQGRVENPSRLGELSTLWFLLEKNWTIMKRQREAQSGRGRLEFEPRQLSVGFAERLTMLVERGSRNRTRCRSRDFFPPDPA